jgi:hypothetical protein
MFTMLYTIGALDPAVDVNGYVIPGIGGMHKRYIEGLAQSNEQLVGEAHPKLHRKRFLGLW